SRDAAQFFAPHLTPLSEFRELRLNDVTRDARARGDDARREKRAIARKRVENPSRVVGREDARLTATFDHRERVGARHRRANVLKAAGDSAGGIGPPPAVSLGLELVYLVGCRLAAAVLDPARARFRDHAESHGMPVRRGVA